MKKHYDFSKGVRGKLYRPAEKLRIPVYLDDDIEKKLRRVGRRPKGDIGKIVNSILRKELEMVDLLG
jgi:hypothetical protein